MTAAIIDGRAAAATIRAVVATEISRMRPRRPPGLVALLVGDDPASEVYVAAKLREAEATGIHGRAHKLPVTASHADVAAAIDELNVDPTVHGILLQLPLPPPLDPLDLLARIDPAKDVDGLHALNAGKLSVGLPGLAPCTPLGVVLLLRQTLGDLTGLHAALIGASNVVGKPLAALLLAERCTVTLCHIHTRDPASLVRTADIVIAATGTPGLVNQEWVKPGATVIDVGITRVKDENGKVRIRGDVDFNSVREVAGAITPVPGGVGPMTIACLLKNTFDAFRAIESKAAGG
jgi:methylenetetrahydrofolate dehydrogenase (NADP+)/methenyltetrahydrofolate cyclohydrolase